ncbi:hypothetical protein BC830DRAFT_938744 [Chytriomyces sp. MP71]|nr:hypothetical protein BC830DRAFT_938744 [Chytriomyces sp. MP71]
MHKQQTTNNYEQSLYYSSIDNDFVGIIASNAGDARVYVNLPLHVNRSDCSICGFWESLSPQELTIADKAGDFSWASWNMFAQAIDGNFHLVNKKFEARSEQWYQAALLAENGESGWTLPFRSSTSNQAARRVYDANKTLQGVVATEIPLTYLTSALQEHLQSQHAYMYLATANGSLVGSSANETLFDSEGNVKDVAQMLRPQMQWSAAYLQNLLLPGENWTSLAGAYTWNGTYFGVSVMQEGPRFVVVTGAPVADYTGPIDRMFHSLAGTLQNCFQAISGFAVTVFAITVVLSCILCHYFVDRPLRKVTDMMAKAREFDFSDFETDEQAHGNIITELNVMESAFLKMIHKFASAIRSNREMNSKKSNLKSGASNQEAASYQPPNLVESKVEYDLPFSESKHTTMARKKRDGQQDEI